MSNWVSDSWFIASSEVIWDQITSNLLVYNFQPPHITSNLLMYNLQLPGQTDRTRAEESGFKSNPFFPIFLFYPIFIQFLSDFYPIFFRLFPIFKLFPTLRLADSTALVHMLRHYENNSSLKSSQIDFYMSCYIWKWARLWVRSLY